MSATVEPVRILYVVGAGHSGSTFLDIALGNDSEVQSVGELQRVLQDGWLGEEYCGCRERVRECPFWREVVSRWIARSGVSVEGYLQLQQSLTRFRSWPALLRERVSPTVRFQRYASLTRELFEEIRSVSGRRVIVDSSKNPVRACALAFMEGVDLRLVHLVRDGRGVAFSHTKDWKKDLKAGVARDVARRSVLRTLADWTLINLEADFLSLRMAPGKSLRVHYEDFMEDPERWMGEIGSVAGVDFSLTSGRVASGELLSVGHNGAGNHVRMSRDLRLRTDSGNWRASLSYGDQRLAWALAWPVLRRYGYER